MSDTSPALVPGRSCDGCAMCCKLFMIPALDKPADSWCRHCEGKQRCGIYETRPQQCANFFCVYLHDAGTPDYWKPSHSHMVVVNDPDGDGVVVHVDPQRPDAWRKQPYYKDLKAWSLNGVKQNRQLQVRAGRRTFIVLPERDVDLSDAGDKLVRADRIQTPQGPTFRITLVDRKDMPPGRR